jgi:hypothetical protein
MPNIRNWEEWDEVEEQLQNEHVRHQVALKNKNKQKKEQRGNEKSNKTENSNKHST